MKIADPGTDTLDAATHGDLAALDAVLTAIQPGVFNLAIRMLGNREDAADATQEILLKVVTHLGGFRRQSAFPTWVFQIARNHLLTAVTRHRESPEISLDSLGERLQQGLAFGASIGDPHASARTLTPEDKLEARQIALGCTQNMLMALDREQRLVYVLDSVFGLASSEAADVLGIKPDAYRQRLARVRARMDAFATGICGEVNAAAPCQCERQRPALQQLRRAEPAPTSTTAAPLRAIHSAERAEAERQFDALLRVGDAAAVFRAHPHYLAPGAMRGAILAVLRTEGFIGDERRTH